ncbi:MAG: M24 family metallopeptidase [Planctomycetota bacterium]|jgi:Xaa-Pro aminopeptidase
MITDEKWRGVCGAMEEAGMDFALVVDRGLWTHPDLMYLAGHPHDAALLLTAAGERFLFPRDLRLARESSRDVTVVDPEGGGRGFHPAVMEKIRELHGNGTFALAFPVDTPHITVEAYKEAFPSARILCESPGIDRILQDTRAVKSPAEIRILEEGFAIADEVIALIPDWLEAHRKKEPRERDLAVFLHKAMFDRGTDGARKAMLVANADRSAQVHPHPQAGDGPLLKPGLALVDFWMVYRGYHTDLTVPLLIEPLTDAQEAMVEVVLGVYRETMDALVPGAMIGEIAGRARETFDRHGLRPVGGLGHGLGLSGHDPPPLAPPPKDEEAKARWRDRRLQPGMVLAVEPGVIHEAHGGFRLENDVVIGEERGEVKTHAAVVRLRA